MPSAALDGPRQTALQAGPFRTKNSQKNRNLRRLLMFPVIAGAGQATVAEIILSNSQEAPLMAETQTSPKANTANASTPATSTGKSAAAGLKFARKFSKAGVSPYDEVQWERRTAAINDMSGKVIFEQKDVEVPVDWSMTATNIVASKYLHGQMNTPERESGVRALVARVAETITGWGQQGRILRLR